MQIRTITLVILSLILTGCAYLGSPKIEIHDLAVREARFTSPTASDLNFRCICDTETGETTSQVYGTIYNRGGGADRLLKVESDVAVKVDLRQPTGQEGVVELVDAIDIPAWGNAVFSPGQYQLTLTGLKGDLRAGETIKLRLFFEISGEVDLDVMIVPRE